MIPKEIVGAFAHQKNVDKTPEAEKAKVARGEQSLSGIELKG